MKQDNMDETINVLIGGGGIGYRNRPMTARLRNGKPQCQGEAYRKVGRFGEWGQCVRAGTYLEPATERMMGAESDKLYYFCASHAPSKVAVRDEQNRQRRSASDAAANRKYAREQAMRDIVQALRANDIEGAWEAFARHEQNVEPA